MNTVISAQHVEVANQPALYSGLDMLQLFSHVAAELTLTTPKMVEQTENDRYSCYCLSGLKYVR